MPDNKKDIQELVDSVKGRAKLERSRSDFFNSSRAKKSPPTRRKAEDIFAISPLSAARMGNRETGERIRISINNTGEVYELVNRLTQKEMDEYSKSYPSFEKRKAKWLDVVNSNYKVVIGTGAGGSGGKVRLARQINENDNSLQPLLAVKKTSYNQVEINQLIKAAQAYESDKAIHQFVRNHSAQLAEGYQTNINMGRLNANKMLSENPLMRADLDKRGETAKFIAMMQTIEANNFVKWWIEKQAPKLLKKEEFNQILEEFNQILAAANNKGRQDVLKEATARMEAARNEFQFHRDVLSKKPALKDLYIPILSAGETKKEGQDKTTVYHFMEYADLGDGLHFAKQVKENTTLTPTEKNNLMLHITESLLKAVATLHENGIYHRDLKAENFLVSSDGKIRLADFGSAEGGGLVVNNRHDLRYLDPKMVVGGDWKKADSWSLGLALAEFYGADLSDYHKAELQTRHPNLIKWPVDLNNFYRNVVEILFWKKPAETVYKDIREILASTPTYKSMDADPAAHAAQMKKIFEKLATPQSAAVLDNNAPQSTISAPPMPRYGEAIQHSSTAKTTKTLQATDLPRHRANTDPLAVPELQSGKSIPPKAKAERPIEYGVMPKIEVSTKPEPHPVSNAGEARKPDHQKIGQLCREVVSLSSKLMSGLDELEASFSQDFAKTAKRQAHPITQTNEALFTAAPKPQVTSTPGYVSLAERDDNKKPRPKK